MLDIKWIRENREEFDKQLAKRGAKIDSKEVIQLDEEHRQLVGLIQQLQQAKNKKSKMLGAARGGGGRDFEEHKRDVQHINEKLNDLNKKLDNSTRLKEIMDGLPNLPDEEVPYGLDESMNRFVRDFRVPTDAPKAKQHFDLGHDLGMMDFEQTAKYSGSRFVTLQGDLARLERALINFMIDQHTKDRDFLEVSPPALVRPEAMYNIGQLPKFAEDSYVTDDGKFRLIPTGEVPLTNIVAGMILSREELPLRFAAYTPCFRQEAGSAGRDSRGMMRNHQFGKVELVTITTPDESKQEHEFMLERAESILKLLDIPYRVMLLCSGDMGFTAKKTYDIEAWMPGQKKYREISSVSNCGDFVGRRMKARFRQRDSKETTFVHTLNGSGLAVGRTIIAILENYQNEDGSIAVPKALVPYMGGQKVISKQ